MVRNMASSAPARARLDPGVDVVGARRRLEHRQRVLADRAARARRRGGGPARGGPPAAAHRPRLDRRSSASCAPRAAAGRARGRPTRHRDPDRGVAVRAVEPLRGQQVRDPARETSSMSAGSTIASPSAERRRRATCSSSSVTRPPARGGSRTRRRRAGSRDRRRTDVPRRRAAPRRRPIRVRAACSMIGSPQADLDPADGRERAARLGDGLVPFGGRVAAPRDAAADVQRQPPAVGDERPDEDARLHRAVGPDPAERAGVRAAPDRLEPLEDLHRADLRRAGDRAARERRGEEVEGVAPAARAGRSPSRRGAGPRPSVRAGTGAGRGRCPDDRRDRGRCAGRRRSSRSRRDPWRSRAARRRAPDPRPRSRPRGRVPLIGSVVTTPSASTARNGSGEADSSARGPPGQRARTEVEVRREERRVPGPQPAVAFPRLGLERRLQPAGEVGLVDLAGGDARRERLRRRPRRQLGRGSTRSGVARRHRCRRGRTRSRRRRGRPGSVRRAWTSSRRRASRRSSPSSARPASQAVADPAIPGDDPVVEREPERRQFLVVDRDRRQALEGVAKVVAEEAHEAAGERRGLRPGRRASRRAGRRGGARRRTDPDPPPVPPGRRPGPP